jgi:hypothetical protein
LTRGKDREVRLLAEILLGLALAAAPEGVALLALDVEGEVADAAALRENFSLLVPPGQALLIQDTP